MYLALAEFEVFSSLSVFSPLASTSAPVYPLPPPTTLVGALAYSYMRLMDAREVERVGGEYYSPAYKLLDSIVYASAGALGYVVTRDVERVYQHVYLRTEYWKDLSRAYTIGVKGSVAYMDNRLYVVYVARDRDVLKYVYGVTRIGRKEGHVALRSLVIEPLEKTSSRRVFETIFYTPTDIAYCTGNTMVTAMPLLDRENYGSTTRPRLGEFYIPKSIGPMQCQLKDTGALVEVGGLPIAIPRSLVG